MTYLQRQRAVLTEGLPSHVPLALRERHAIFLTKAQNADGGFSGRGGDSDLYYTAFALWGLAILGELTEAIARQAVGFLMSHWRRPNHLVDFFSLLHAYRLLHDQHGEREFMRDALPEELRGQEEELAGLVTAALETCRAADGGYGRTPEPRNGSTYATFLSVLCYDELERPIPERERVLSFLTERQREDGGYVELAPMRRSGTNPTAAAVAILRLLGASAEEDKARDFLAAAQSFDGGLRANTVIPVGDLLSTFTGLWTLHDLGGLDAIDRRAALRFAVALQEKEGGFLAGLWDDGADVEYTFYGLGSLALVGESGDWTAG